MILEEEVDNFRMRYDFNEKRLSMIIHNEEDGSDTQINIGIRSISKLANLLEVLEAMWGKLPMDEI